jgi:hypothetical protein
MAFSYTVKTRVDFPLYYEIPLLYIMHCTCFEMHYIFGLGITFPRPLRDVELCSWAFMFGNTSMGVHYVIGEGQDIGHHQEEGLPGGGSPSERSLFPMMPCLKGFTAIKTYP